MDLHSHITALVRYLRSHGLSSAECERAVRDICPSVPGAMLREALIRSLAAGDPALPRDCCGGLSQPEV